MEKNVSMQLAEFANNINIQNIPMEIQEFTKCLTLKTVAGIVAGSKKPSGEKMAELIKSKNLPGDVKIIGGDFKTSIWESVYLNSYFAHASELEDDRFEDAISWDITVIPLLLPLAQSLKLSGEALLEALVAGLEVHARTCFFSGRHMKMTVIPGAVGPAVAGAKAFKMSPDKMVAAMGLALSGATITDVNLGTDGHFFESALQALQGMMAAEMASVGLMGSSDLAKYLSDYLGKERVEPEKMIEGLWGKWVLRDIQIKKYPCCLMLHRQIDSVIDLKTSYDLSYDDIETVEIHASPGDTILDRPYPKDENDIQFSFQHVLAAAMLDGDVNLEHMTQDAVSDSKLSKARSKVKFILNPELDHRWLKARSYVIIKTKNGKAYPQERMYQIGHPKDPLTVEQFQGLYRKFTENILSEEATNKTSDMILNLEKLENIDELMSFL